MFSVRHIFYGAAVATAALLFSCGGNEIPQESLKELVFKEYHYSLDTILRNKSGIIHGIELGEKLNDVKLKEPKKPDEMDVDYCLYNYKIDSLSNYSLAYSFVGDSLDEIEVNINTVSLDHGGVILDAIKKYYTDKYTAPLMDNGVYVFNCFDSKKRNFIISISDNSTTETGVINLLVYREK